MYAQPELFALSNEPIRQGSSNCSEWYHLVHFFTKSAPITSKRCENNMSLYHWNFYGIHLSSCSLSDWNWFSFDGSTSSFESRLPDDIENLRSRWSPSPTPRKRFWNFVTSSERRRWTSGKLSAEFWLKTSLPRTRCRHSRLQLRMGKILLLLFG